MRQKPNAAKTQRGKNPLVYNQWVYKPISELGLQTYQWVRFTNLSVS
jgi:hypothetical protein